MNIPLFITLALSLVTSTARAQDALPEAETPVSPTHLARIEGRLFEKGTRKPIAGANIFILPTKLKASTDAEGRFIIDGMIAEQFRMVVNVTGYQRLDRGDQLQAEGLEPNREIFLERASYQIYETTVVGQGDKRDDTRRSLKRSQFINLPGSGGDPIKSVQNLPGVNRAAPFSSQVVIQGSSPRDTRYMIDQHEVPIIFHFGGLSSVVMPEALDRVDYFSAGFGSENGRAIGGLVGVWTKAPEKDRLHGMGFVDTFNAGAMAEGPVGQNGSFLIGGRQSYIGHVLRAVLKKDSSFNLTVAPEYRDLVAIYQTDLTPIDQFKVLTVASDDTLEFLLTQPANQDPAIRGNFSNETAFVRLIPQLTHKHSESTTSRWSLGAGRDWIRLDSTDNYFKLSTYQLTSRAELEHKFSEIWTAQWGLDNRYTTSKVDLQLRDFYSSGGVSNPYSSGSIRRQTVSSDYNLVGAYWRNEIQPSGSPWTYLPSMRADYTSRTNEFLPQPRLAARYKIDDYLKLRAATGLYAQPPQEQESDSVAGNPDIKSPKAVHFSGGFDKDFRDGSSTGWLFSGGGFYKHLYNLPIASTRFVTRNGVTTAENYNNQGSGRAYGLEAMLKGEFSPITGWLSYTLSRSTRWNDSDPTERSFQYDQTHILTAIAAREFDGHWRLSGRLRYATGNPTTTVTGGIYDSDNDVYIPTRGPIYSERLDPFFQLDLRIDKKWIYNKWIMSIYLDIQNVTNRQNIEAIRYSYDYRSKTTVSGLPILPTFGVKGEF